MLTFLEVNGLDIPWYPKYDKNFSKALEAVLYNTDIFVHLKVNGNPEMSLGGSGKEKEKKGIIKVKLDEWSYADLLKKMREELGLG